MLKHARTYGYKKICQQCGEEFTTKWAAAKFCKGKCRMAALRKRNKQEIKVYCKWCGKPFDAQRGNADYCLPAHKQAAYRARKGAGKQAMF